MRSQAVASGTAPDATEPGAVVVVVEEDLSHLPSYARPTRASLGHVKRGVRASTGSLPTAHRPLSAPKPQQHVRTDAADAATDAVVRRGSSRRSTAGDTARHALESIHEVPAAAATAPEAVPCKRSALSCAGVKHAAATKTSRHSTADTAAHRDLGTSHGDQSVRSSMSGRSRGSLPGSKYPNRSTASASTGSRPAPASGSRPSSSRAAPVSAPWSRPSSAASGQGASSTSTSSSSGSGSRAVSAPALDRSGSAAAGTGSTRGAVKGRKSVTPRAAVTSTDLAGTAGRVAQPLSKSARSVSSATSVITYLAAPLTAGASAGGAFKGRKASVGAAGASGAGAGARANRASVVRASRDSTSSGLQAGVAAAHVAGPAKPSASPRPSISAEPAAATAATAAAVQDAAAAGVGTAALDRVAEADALCAAVATAANSRSVQTAATTAGPARSITPDALVPAPGFGTLITPSAIGPTPYGPTPMPPTAFKQGWRPGATPEATPGGLMGHFTALVTPGGACWPQGMPAGGLVPYSITPPDGGRTEARTGAATRGIGGRTPAAVGTSAAGAGAAAAAAGAAARLEQGFAAATESPLESFAAASEGHREGLRTQSARPYRSVTPSAASAAGASRSSSVRRSMTPTEEDAGLVPGADGPDSSRRSQTPGRTPHSAAKNAALAAQLQNLEQTWGQYKETSGRSSISCSPARARSVPRGSSMRSSIGMTGTRSSLSYSPADLATATATSAAAGRNKSPAALVAAMAKSPAGKTAGQSTKQLPQLPGVALMQELKAAAAAAEAAWYASKSGEEETQEELPACEQTDSPAAPAAAGSANAGVSKAPGKTPVVQAAARAGSSGAHLSASKETFTGSSRPHRYSSGSNATPLSTARPATRGSAGNPGKTPAAAAAAHATNSAARLTGTKRQTPSRMAAAAVAVTPAADGVAANAAPAEGMASGAKWSATAQWAAPSPSASPSFTAKKASKRTGKTPLRHGSAARATKSLTAAADASGGAGTAVPFSGFAAAVAEGSPAAASAGAQAGHVIAQSGTPTFGALPATADVPDSPSNIDVSGDIEEVAERLADFSIQQYELLQQQQRVTSPDAAVGGTGVKTPLGSSRQGLHPGPSAVQASWMAFAAGAPGSTSSAGRVKTPPRFRLSGVGVAAGLSGSSHGRGTGGAPMGGGSQALTPTSAAAAGSSGGSRVQRSIPKAPLAVATTTATAATAAGANAGSSRGSSGATTPTGSESEFYSPLQCTPGSGKSQSHASRLAAEEAAAAAAEPSSVEKLSRKYAALSLIPKAPGTTAVAAAGAAAGAVPGPGDAFFTPVEGLVQGAASPGFSSARRQGLATATTAAAAGDDVAVSSASKRRRVAAAAAAAVAAAFGGSQADAEAAAAAAAAVVATAQASGGSVGAVRAASQPAKVSKQLLDLFDTAAIEPSVTPPSVPSAAAAAAGGAVSRVASSTPGSTGSTGTGSASRPMRRLSSGAMRTPIVPLSDSPAAPTAAAAAAGVGASKTTAVSAGVNAPAGVAASSKTPATAGAGKLPAAAGAAAAAAEYAALGARAAFFDVPEVGTPLFPPHTPAATPLKTGFGALSARKLAHIGSGARRVTTAVPASRRKQQQEWGGQEAESAQVPAAAAPKTVVSGAEAAAAAAAALYSRIGKGPAAIQPEAAAVAAVTPSAGTTQRAGAGAYSIPASANKPMTRRYVAALTPQAAAPAPAAARSPEAEAPADATAAAVARYNRAGAAAAAAAAAAAGGHPGSGPNGPIDTLVAAAAAAAAGFDVGFRPSPTFKVQSKFPPPAATPAAAGTPGSAGFGSSGIGSPSFATTESDTASTGQGRSGAGGSALKSTAKSGRSANKMFSGGLTKARQLLKAALPKGSSSSKASTKQAAGSGESGASAPAAAVTATGGAGGEAQGVWEVTDSYALSQQQSFDDARGAGYDDQAREVPSCAPFRGASLSKGQFPGAAAAAGGSGRVRSPPQAAGGAGMLGAWDAADMALPIEAMSDTAYVTTRRRH